MQGSASLRGFSLLLLDSEARIISVIRALCGYLVGDDISRPVEHLTRWHYGPSAA